MPEALKNLYNKQLISDLAETITNDYSAFDQQAFKKSVFDKNWKYKELKQRMRHWETPSDHHHKWHRTII
jgi:3-methyladenine DNA glycosylase AlkC